ncbi:ChaN family lipoprotein [Rubrivirga sp.]|uniref:ChaN family lipoprotein n=1 Tax=Rubrivirga sp. TaxID=1885344 RepID=UPI003B51F086
MRLPLAMLIATVALAPRAQPSVLDANGQSTTLDAVVEAAATADVVFLGEQHDDSTGHAVQRQILQALVALDRPVVLALEMVETDVQTVLDEYLAGLVRERDWLAAGRPWSNYDADYRPLVETMRAQGRPVVAANAPARYVSLVSRRGGLAVLDSLSEEARAWLPPTVAPPSDALAANFTDLMGGMPHGAGPTVEGMLAAQNLRDATMAWRIAETLDAHPGALVVHLNGSFHSQGRLGIPEHLARLAPDARVVVVTMAPDGTPTPGDDFTVRTAR